MVRPQTLPTLPIAEALPALRAALATHRSAVLHAPPGAGKSTVVPLALLAEPWVGNRKILMLEPRRLAARAVAQRMAQTLGEEVGQTVGYRMRLDTRVSRATRIEVLTEGVLTRRLAEDPALEDVALVIFDEFHERNLVADLGLAFTLDAREVLAPQLRVLAMSATLDIEPVAKLLGDAVVVRSAGRQFPVETRYVGQGLPQLGGVAVRSGQPPEQMVARGVRDALAETEGDVLVFLPGAAEIRRVASLLEAMPPPLGSRVLPLFGELDAQAQDAALAPAAAGHRKIILATNLAETSLTIAGVRVVVDSGLMRRSLFDPATGMSHLEMLRISRASADQRQGRAGRTAPGICYRLWSEGAHASLAATTPAEILEADLAPLALELAHWGTTDVQALRWLDPPPATRLAGARDLLRRLGALDASHRITQQGRAMIRLGVHPRLAHMLLAAGALGASALAARLAALLSDRDGIRGGERDPDIRSRLPHIADSQAGERGAGRRVAQHARELLRRVEDSRETSKTRNQQNAIPVVHQTHHETRSIPEANRMPATREERTTAIDPATLPGALLALAYPDRIAQRRSAGDSRYLLANGRGAQFAEPCALSREEFLVVVDVDDRERDARIRLAAPIAKADIEEQFAAQLETRGAVLWDSREQAVTARATVRLDALVLDDKPLAKIPADLASAALLQGIRELGLAVLPWTKETRDLQARLSFLRAQQPDAGWPAVDEASLTATLETWLAPWLGGITRREHFARIDLLQALRALLNYDAQQRLDTLAPTHLQMPSGSRIRVDYLDEKAPVVAVRLQEVFGLFETPRIAGGRVPVTFQLLSPAQRPVQITRDLASFWNSGYAEVRRDLRGRYPKHYWPENPLEAEATRFVRKR